MSTTTNHPTSTEAKVTSVTAHGYTALRLYPIDGRPARWLVREDATHHYVADYPASEGDGLGAIERYHQQVAEAARDAPYCELCGRRGAVEAFVIARNVPDGGGGLMDVRVCVEGCP